MAIESCEQFSFTYFQRANGRTYSVVRSYHLNIHLEKKRIHSHTALSASSLLLIYLFTSSPLIREYKQQKSDKIQTKIYIFCFWEPSFNGFNRCCWRSSHEFVDILYAKQNEQIDQINCSVQAKFRFSSMNQYLNDLAWQKNDRLDDGHKDLTLIRFFIAHFIDILNWEVSADFFDLTNTKKVVGFALARHSTIMVFLLSDCKFWTNKNILN